MSADRCRLRRTTHRFKWSQSDISGSIGGVVRTRASGCYNRVIRLPSTIHGPFCEILLAFVLVSQSECNFLTFLETRQRERERDKETDSERKRETGMGAQVNPRQVTRMKPISMSVAEMQPLCNLTCAFSVLTIYTEWTAWISH